MWPQRHLVDAVKQCALYAAPLSSNIIVNLRLPNLRLPWAGAFMRASV